MDQLPISQEQITQWTDKIIDVGFNLGGNILGALGILIIGWMVASYLHRVVRRSLDKTKRVDATLKPLLASIVRYVVLVFVVVAVLAQFGVETTSIIAVLGAAGLAVGLALQGTLSNIAAGVMILILRPLRIGEYVNTGDAEGSVEEVGLFTTTMKTFDGIYISIPNSQIWGKSIKNFSRNATRRIDIAVGIGYDDDIDKGLKVFLDLLKKDKRILKDPAPETMVKALGDSSVMINMRAWVNASDYWSTFFDLNKKAFDACAKNGLSIPYPQRDIHLFTDNAIKASVKK